MMMISRHGSVNRTATATMVIKIIVKAMDQMQHVSNVSKVATVMDMASHAKRINVKAAGESVDTKIKKKYQFKPISIHRKQKKSCFLKIMHFC